MSTAASVVAQLQAELARANTATGGSAASVHAAITALIAGYGGGGGVETGTYIPANTAASITIPVSAQPSSFVLCKKLALEATNDYFNILAAKLDGAEVDLAIEQYGTSFTAVPAAAGQMVSLGTSSVTVASAGGFVGGAEYIWLAVVAGASAPPVINGSAFDCGTFTLSENAANGTTVNHNLGAAPSAVFLWSDNAPFTARGILGKIRFHDNEIASTSMLAANGALAASIGASGGAYRTSWDAATITFSASSSYPLLASLTYQWLAIA